VTEQIEHDPEALRRKIPLLVEAEDLLLEIDKLLGQGFGQIGSLIDGEATDELSQNVEKVFDNTLMIVQTAVTECGKAIGSQAYGVNNAKTVRDIAGENATTAGDFMGTGRH